MAERNCESKIQMLYSFDRLANRKISQVYRLLVPQKRWPFKKNIRSLKTGDTEGEDSGNLRTSIIG